MTKPRNDSMDPTKIETHHVWSRVVQRAMLIGVDPLTKIDYSGRRDVLRSLLKYQSEVFAVDVGNYAILGNHFHGLLRSRPDIVAAWSDEECAFRYKSAWPSWGNDAEDESGRHWIDDDNVYHRKGNWCIRPTDDDVRKLLRNPDKMEAIRTFLGSISGFMARVKQPVAHLFNQETEVTGSYWGRRFGNRLLVTPTEVVGGSIYLDLNHARAGTATSLETSHPSGIQDRVLAAEARRVWIAENTESSLEQIYQDLVHGTSDLPPAVLEELFGDAWLAPITNSGPRYSVDIARIQMEAQPASSVKEPVGELTEEDQDVGGNVSDPTAKQQDAKTEPNHDSDATLNQTREPATFLLQEHYRTRLKRRKSDWCFIDASASTYQKTVEQLAKEIVDAHTSEPAATSECHSEVPSSGQPELAVDWKTTASEVYRDFRSFLAKTGSVIASCCSPNSPDEISNTVKEALGPSADDSAPDSVGATSAPSIPEAPHTPCELEPGPTNRAQPPTS